MPYEIVHPSADCPAGKSWAVRNKDTGEVKGCHETEAKAKAHMKALYANEPSSKVKSELKKLRVELDEIKFARRSDAREWQAADRAVRRWEKRWARAFEDELVLLEETQNFKRLIKIGQRAWKARPNADEVARQLRADAPRGWEDGALVAYLNLATDLGEDAGQFTLDALGLNKTFSWASVRDFPKNLYAVRGSKVIQHAHGAHLDALARKVVEHTNPVKPGNIADLTRDIKQSWSALRSHEALRIARTESRAAWTATKLNAMKMNGVEMVGSYLAQGPSVGVRSEDPCDYCVDFASGGPYRIEDLEDEPPLHPNCRCALLPELPDDWLPPQEPWAGEPVPGLVPAGDLSDRGEAV